MPEWTPRLEANVLLDFEGELRDLAAYEAYGGYAQLKRALDGMDADTLIAELGGSALRGRGGPAASATWSSTPTSRSRGAARTAS